jgi:spoIIIJ-associated protein
MDPKDEFEGKSVEAAVEAACRELNVGKDQLKYDVLSYGATGIFGIVGAKKAKIRVKGSRSGKKAKATGGKNAKPVPEAPTENAQSVPEKPEPPPTADPPASHPRRPVEKNKPAEDEDFDAPEEERVSLVALEEAASAGKSILERILAAISDETRIVVELEGQRIFFDVKGENPAVLIGKRGQTLEAIQYLVDKAVNQKLKNRVRVVVDVEGYWENRRASLQEMARKMADKSRQTGKPITLGQMNAQDRRIVHLTLKEDPSVKTQSRGEGFYRKLVIFPRKGSHRKTEESRS